MNLFKRVISACLIFVFVFSVFSSSVITASALSENARYYESIPETVYATAGKAFKIYYNNILSMPHLKVVFDTPDELDRKCFEDHIEITSKIPGDFVVSWRVYDNEYVLIDSGEMHFIVRDMALKNATGLVIGDSTISAGVVTQTLLDIYEKNNKKLTLLGSNGTYPNLHEGRSGWTASLYCATQSDGIYYNYFYNDGFDFTYYMASQGYEGLDFVIIQLGINDIKTMTLENYSSKKVLSYFDKMILSIREYDSELPIILGVTIPPSEDVEKYNNNSTISSEFEYRNNIIHFASDLMNYFAGVENVYFSSINCVINSSTQFKDAIHPTPDGYKTIANEYISCINGIVNKKIQVKAPVISETKIRNGYITISWDATYGAESYDVIKNGKVIFTTTKLSYKDADVSSGESYKYKIRANCKKGTVYTSKAETVCYLGVPVLKSATVTQNGVSVKWNSVNSAEEYIVYRKTADSSWAKVGKTTSIAFTDKTAKSGTKYFYTVAAASSVAKSSYDNCGVSVYYLATPSLSSVTNKNGSVGVKWGAVKGAKGYNVYRKTSKNGKWTKVATTTNTTYTDKNVKSGSNYYYTVKAYNGENKSSCIKNGIVTKYLATPKPTKITSTKKGVSFSYSKITGAAGYAIYRKTGNGKWVKIATVEGNNKTTYLDKTAEKGVTYTYTVKAVNGKYMSYYNTTGLKIKDKY